MGDVNASEKKYRLPLTQLGIKFSSEEKSVVSAALHGDEEALKVVEANDKLSKYYQANVELTKKDRALREMVPGAHQTVIKPLKDVPEKITPEAILAGEVPATKEMSDFERALLSNAGPEAQGEFFKTTQREIDKTNALRAGKVEAMHTKSELVGKTGYAHPEVLREEPGIKQSLIKEARDLGFGSVREVLKVLDNPDDPLYTVATSFSKKGQRELYRLKNMGTELEAKIAEGAVRPAALPSSARARVQGEGFVPDPSEQWRAAITGTHGTKRAEQVALTNQASLGMLDQADAPLYHITGNKQEAAIEAQRLTDLHNTKFVMMGETQSGKNMVEDMLRTTQRPGERAADQFLVVPEVIRDTAQKLYPEIKEQGPAMKMARGISSYLFEPLMSMWRLTTTAGIPAFATTNATGAAELSFLAEGFKAANPGLQGGAAATALAAFFHGSGPAKALKYPVGGQMVPLADLAKVMTEDGVIGLAGGRFGEDLGHGKGPLGLMATGANTVARALGMKALNQITEDYQHATVYLSRLKGLDRESRMVAANAAREMTGGYGALSSIEQKYGIPKLFAFHGWMRFYTGRTASVAWNDPARLTFFDKVKEYYNQHNSPETPESIIPGEALPGWQQIAGVYTAPRDLQIPNKPAGDDRFVVQTFQTPSQYLAQALMGDKDWAVRQMGPVVQATLAMITGMDPQTGQKIPESGEWLKKYGILPLVAETRLTKFLGKIQQAYRAGKYRTAMDYADQLYLGNEAQFLSPAIEAVTGVEIPWSLGRQNYITAPGYQSGNAAARDAQKAFDIINKQRSRALDLSTDEED